MAKDIPKFQKSNVHDIRVEHGLCSLIGFANADFYSTDEGEKYRGLLLVNKGRVFMFDVVRASRYYSGERVYFIKGGYDTYVSIFRDILKNGSIANESGFYKGKQLEYRMKTLRRCINRCDRLIRRYSK